MESRELNLSGHMISPPRFFTRRSLIFGTLVCAAALCVAWADLSRHTNWTPDGYVYARMMLKDVGASDEDAKDAALRFYLSTPVGSGNRYRPYFMNESLGMFTPEAKPFGSRVLYPYLASLLYRSHGFQSLILIS